MLQCMCLFNSGVDRVACDEGKQGEICHRQMPASSIHLAFTLCIIFVICGNCVTLAIGHKFNVDLALRWIVVFLASFVLCVIFDTVKVCVLWQIQNCISRPIGLYVTYLLTYYTPVYYIG